MCGYIRFPKSLGFLHVEVEVVAEGQSLCFDLLVVIQVPDLVAADPGEFNAVEGLVDLQNFDANLCLQCLVALVLGDDCELCFVFLSIHLGFYILGLHVLHQGRFYHVRVVSREELGLVAEHVVVWLKLLKNRQIFHRCDFI